MPRIKKENAIFGRYPCCDLLNRALRFMLDGNYESAREDVILAIYKADGYFYKDVAERLGIGECKKRKGELSNIFCTLRDDEIGLTYLFFVKENEIDSYRQKYGENFKVLL